MYNMFDIIRSSSNREKRFEYVRNRGVLVEEKKKEKKKFESQFTYIHTL